MTAGKELCDPCDPFPLLFRIDRAKMGDCCRVLERNVFSSASAAICGFLTKSCFGFVNESLIGIEYVALGLIDELYAAGAKRGRVGGVQGWGAIQQREQQLNTKCH